MLRSDFYDYSDAYIIVKGSIGLGVAGNNNTAGKGVILKNNASFRSSISITHSWTIQKILILSWKGIIC